MHCFCALLIWIIVKFKKKKKYIVFVFKIILHIYSCCCCFVLFFKEPLVTYCILSHKHHCPCGEHIPYVKHSQYCLLFRIRNLWIPEAAGGHDGEKGDQTERWGNKTISGDFPFFSLLVSSVFSLLFTLPLNCFLSFVLLSTPLSNMPHFVYEWATLSLYWVSWIRPMDSCRLVYYFQYFSFASLVCQPTYKDDVTS